MKLTGLDWLCSRHAVRPYRVIYKAIHSSASTEHSNRPWNLFSLRRNSKDLAGWISKTAVCSIEDTKGKENTDSFHCSAPVKTRRSWCKLEYDVEYYAAPDRQITNIEISTSTAPPPPLVAMTLSLVTLPNSRTHETEVSERKQDGDVFKRLLVGDLCGWSRSSTIPAG